MKRVSTLILIGLLCLTGCSKVNSAEDIASRYLKQKSDSYHIAGDINITAVSSDDSDLSIDETFTLSLMEDVYKDMSHSLAEIESSSDGSVTYSANVESYLGEDNNYYFDGGIWTLDENPEFDYSYLTNIDPEWFTDAEITKLDSGDSASYSMTIPLSKLSNSEDISNMLGDFTDDSLTEAFSHSNVTYFFDSDYNLVRMAYNATAMNTEITVDEGTYTTDISLEFDFRFSNYGGIKQDTVLASDQLKNGVALDSEQSDEEPEVIDVAPNP